MEFQDQVQTGVEDVPAAEEQDLGVEKVDQMEEPSQSEPQTGVEKQSDASDQIKDEKDFAAALRAREQKLREQLEKEYAEKYKDYNDIEKRAKYLERLAKVEGVNDINLYLETLENRLAEWEIQRKAEEMGIDEETYRKYLQPVNEKLIQYERELEQFRKAELQRQIESKLAKLRSENPDFDQYKDRVFDLAATKGYDLEDAYIIASFKDKLDKARTEAQNEALQKMQENINSTPGSLGTGGSEKFDFSSLPKEQQRKIIEEVKAGRRKSLYEPL